MMGKRKTLFNAAKNGINALCALLKEYESIGTVDECRSAMNKQIPKQPICKHYEEEGETPYVKITCPNGCGIRLYPVTDKNFAHEHVYCPKCGQKIDWE